MTATAADSDEGFRRHGGRLAAAASRFGAAAEPWLDLSTGVNPHPWRGQRAPVAALAHLPDPAAVRGLEAAAARAFGCDPARVAATAGAEAALRLIPWATGAASAAIVSPTSGGHAEAWALAGAQLSEVPLGLAAGDGSEALVVVNPNNPDGAICDPAGLADGRRWLIVDESFVEVAPERSVARLSLPRTVVLRSFGKFYGLPGVRLGFVVAEPETAARVRALVGDWPVGADAIALGIGAYADTAWAAAMRERLAIESALLDGLLAGAGFRLIGGTALFRLVSAPDAARRFEQLAGQGVLTRPFAHDAALLRFGLPGPQAWGRLARALDGL